MSPSAARDCYGVVLTNVDGEWHVDAAETARLRRDGRAAVSYGRKQQCSGLGGYVLMVLQLVDCGEGLTDQVSRTAERVDGAKGRD